MSKSSNISRVNSRNLLNQLLDNPALPAYVGTLAAPVLRKLVHHIGKEDAQELMLYATDRQVEEIIEADAWANTKPGQQETFVPEKFLEWLLLWQDMSPAFLATKVKALGSELLALALDHYVVVVDLEEVGVSGSVDTFGNLGVMPRDEEGWEIIFNLLGDLWSEDAPLLEEALAYCCMRRSLTVEKTYITGNENLSHNVEGQRDQHRRERAYVTPASAAGFLDSAVSASLEALLIEVAYDPSTAMQLRKMRQERSADNAGTFLSEPIAELCGAEDDEQALEEGNRRALDALLIQHKIVELAPVDRLLAAPTQERELPIRAHLRTLAQDDPVRSRLRQDEILYLANVLMEGIPIQGQRIDEARAVKGVLATCNLGLEYCLGEGSWGSAEEVLHGLLYWEPGLIKAFRVGFSLLSKLPDKIALRHFGTERVTSDEMIRLLDTLHPMIDNTLWQQLRILADVFPCFPNSLEPGAVASVYVDKRWRFIESTIDLLRLDSFIEESGDRLLA